jgi:hypothetical protein
MASMILRELRGRFNVSLLLSKIDFFEIDDDLRERDALAERRIPETLPTTMDVFSRISCKIGFRGDE